MKVRPASTSHASFWCLLSHIVKNEITIIVLGMSFRVGDTLTVQNRNEFDVVANILWMAILGSKRSEIMARCGLDHGLLERYMTTAVVLNLVSVERGSENFYRITSRGLDFLCFYHGLHWLLWGKNFDSLLVNILARLETGRTLHYIR